MDYKNADKKALKENLKNNIHTLLTEGFDEYYTQQQKSTANNEAWKQAGLQARQQGAAGQNQNNVVNDKYANIAKPAGNGTNVGTGTVATNANMRNLSKGFNNGGLQTQGNDMAKNIDAIDKAPYQNAVEILKQVVANSNGNNNQIFRQARLKEFQELGGANVQVTPTTVNVSQMRPTQNIIAADGSLGYILYKHPELIKENVANAFRGNVKINNTPIITCGNYIVDGHHRWSQTYLLNPSATMDAIDIGGGFNDKSQILKIVQIAIANSELGQGKGLPLSNAEGGINLLGNPGQAKKLMMDYIKKAPGRDMFAQTLYPYISQNQSQLEENMAPAAMNQSGGWNQQLASVCLYCGNNAANLSNFGTTNDPDRRYMPQTDKADGGIEGVEVSLETLADDAKAKQPAQNVAENKKNNNMRLTESQLRQIVRESAKKVISEINKEYEDMHKAKAYDDYLGQNMFKRGWDIVTGKRPEKPYPYTPNEPMSARAQRYADAFNQSHRLGNRVDYDNGESYNSRMNWSDDPENRYEPVLTQTTFDGSTVAQQRKAYDEAGNEKEWGIEYPYSEMGYTGEYEGDNSDIKRRSAEFKKLRGEVSSKLAASKKERDKKSKKNESIVRMSQSEFQKFITESVKNVIKEMSSDDFDFDRNLYGDVDRIGKRYAEKAKYGYGNLDEGPWEDDGEMELARARVKGDSFRQRRNMEDHMNEMDEYEASWDTLKKNPDYNSGGMGPAYQKYGIPDDVLYGDR